MEKKIVPGENVFSEGTDLSFPGSVTVRKDGNDSPSDGFVVYHFDGEFLYKFGMGLSLVSFGVGWFRVVCSWLVSMSLI